MRRIRLNFFRWLPSYLRGGLWVGIAVLTAYNTALQAITDEQYAAMSSRQWHLLWTGVTLAGLVAWRTYIDSSHATQKEKIANETTIPSCTAVAGANQPVP